MQRNMLQETNEENTIFRGYNKSNWMAPKNIFIYCGT